MNENEIIVTDFNEEDCLKAFKKLTKRLNNISPLDVEVHCVIFETQGDVDDFNRAQKARKPKLFAKLLK